jgi:hypothetical protein
MTTRTTKRHLQANGMALCKRHDVKFATESTKVVNVCATCLKAAAELVHNSKTLLFKNFTMPEDPRDGGCLYCGADAYCVCPEGPARTAEESKARETRSTCDRLRIGAETTK